MRKITKRLIKLSAEHLKSGEELLVGVRVSLKGTALGVGLSAAGVRGGSKVMSEGQDQAKDAGIPFAQQMALGLTSQRMIVWSRSQWTGKPKDLLGEIPLTDITWGTVGPGSRGDTCTLKLSEDKVLELESVKIDKGEEFVNELKTFLASD